MADNTISVKWDKAKKEFHGTLSHKWEPITRKPDDSRTFITPYKDIYVGATAKQAGQWVVHCMHLYSADGHYVPKVNRNQWTLKLPDSVRKHVPFTNQEAFDYLTHTLPSLGLNFAHDADGVFAHHNKGYLTVNIVTCDEMFGNPVSSPEPSPDGGLAADALTSRRLPESLIGKVDASPEPVVSGPQPKTRFVIDTRKVKEALEEYNASRAPEGGCGRLGA
jgi:hypothetical protein